VITIGDLVTRPGPGGSSTQVFAHGYLVGEYTVPYGAEERRAGVLYPAVAAPTGEGWSLPACQGSEAAVREILTAANQYRYRPHPVVVSTSQNLLGEVSSSMWCWTCPAGTAPAAKIASGADRGAVIAQGLAEHLRRGQHAVVLPHLDTIVGVAPIRLPADQPPTNSAYHVPADHDR
jgi:hypothetical protein